MYYATAHTHNILPAVFGSSANTLIVATDPVASESDFFPRDNRTAVTLASTIGPPLLRCVCGHEGDTGLGSYSPPSVVWVRNGEQLVGGGRITITESTTLSGRRRVSDLQISSFSSSDVGVYQCIFTDVDSDSEVITTTPLRLDTGWR